MDDIVEDSRREIEVLLSMWQTQGQTKGGPFQPHSARLVESPKSEADGQYFKHNLHNVPDPRQMRFVVSDMSRESTMVDEERGHERAPLRKTVTLATSPQSTLVVGYGSA